MSRSTHQRKQEALASALARLQEDSCELQTQMQRWQRLSQTWVEAQASSSLSALAAVVLELCLWHVELENSYRVVTLRTSRHGSYYLEQRDPGGSAPERVVLLASINKFGDLYWHPNSQALLNVLTDDFEDLCEIVEEQFGTN